MTDPEQQGMLGLHHTNVSDKVPGCQSYMTQKKIFN